MSGRRARFEVEIRCVKYLYDNSDYGYFCERPLTETLLGLWISTVTKQAAVTPTRLQELVGW